MMADALETDFEVEATIEIDVASYDDTDGVFTDATIEDLAVNYLYFLMKGTHRH
jgi:hypothetical protein